MDYSHLEQRVRNSYRYITKNKNPDFEDDCVQECLLSFHLKGKGQTVDQAVIDFLRTMGGRKDSVNYETRMSLLNYKEIPESANYDDHHHIPLVLTVNLKGRLKVIVEMYGEGYTFKEIGQQLTLTESRVSQLFTNYTTKMQFIVGLPKEVRNWAVGHVF
jgi:DNA-binding NarL/FixJ family response regulator